MQRLHCGKSTAIGYIHHSDYGATVTSQLPAWQYNMMFTAKIVTVHSPHNRDIMNATQRMAPTSIGASNCAITRPCAPICSVATSATARMDLWGTASRARSARTAPMQSPRALSAAIALQAALPYRGRLHAAAVMQVRSSRSCASAAVKLAPVGRTDWGQLWRITVPWRGTPTALRTPSVR